MMYSKADWSQETMDLFPGGKMPIFKSGDVNWDVLWGLTHFICRVLYGYFENIQRFKCGIGSLAQLKRASFLKKRQNTGGSFCASVNSAPLWSSICMIFLPICQTLEGHSCSLNLSWFVCKGRGNPSILFPRIKWAHGDETRLALGILWSPRVFSVTWGVVSSTLTFVIDIPYCERPHRWVCRQTWPWHHSYLGFPGS